MGFLNRLDENEEEFLEDKGMILGGDNDMCKVAWYLIRMKTNTLGALYGNLSYPSKLDLHRYCDFYQVIWIRIKISIYAYPH